MFIYEKDIVYLVYVDNIIIARPDPATLEDLISKLGIADEEQRHTSEICDEGGVYNFVDIRIKKSTANMCNFSQTGLINKVLKAVEIDTCNTTKTPCYPVALGKDEDGDPFNENREYAVVVGMLIYLATNSRPDILYSINQCARFTHNPK